MRFEMTYNLVGCREYDVVACRECGTACVVAAIAPEGKMMLLLEAEATAGPGSGYPPVRTSPPSSPRR